MDDARAPAAWRRWAMVFHLATVALIVAHAALTALGADDPLLAAGLLVAFPLTYLVHPFTVGIEVVLVASLAAGIVGRLRPSRRRAVDLDAWTRVG